MQIEKKAPDSHTATPANNVPANNGHDEVGSRQQATEHGGPHASSGAAREFQNILEDIQDLLAEAASLTGKDLGQVATKIGDHLVSARNSAADFGGVITQQARKTAATTDSYVHENPWLAAGVAFGMGAATGLLVGYMLTRRS